MVITSFFFIEIQHKMETIFTYKLINEDDNDVKNQTQIIN